MRVSHLLACAAAVAAAPHAVEESAVLHVVHEERDSHPDEWVKQARVHPDSILPVRIGLTQNNLDNAHEMLMDVSSPDSPNFGKHWTSEEVIEAFKPSDETVETVKAWLKSAGFSTVSQSDNKGWLAFNAPAHKVENLLRTEFFEYEHAGSGSVQPSCDRYHVPQNVQAHIDYITPGLKLLAPTPRKARRGDLARRSEGMDGHPSLIRHGGWPWPGHGKPEAGDLKNCDELITPQCVAALYDIPPSTRQPNPDNVMGIYESDLQFWDQKDLDLFFKNFTKIPQGVHPSTNSIDGGVAKTNNVSEGGGEMMLDLELAYPIVYPQSIVIWDENDLHYQSWNNDTSSFGFNQLLDSMDGSYCTYKAFGEKGDAPGIDPKYPDPTPKTGYDHPLQCGVFKPTTVISASYGGQEVDVPIAYQKRQCNEFLKLGLQGTSFLFASGDTGVQQYPARLGGYDGPTGCLGKKLNAFNPTWPNTCPYLTTVGATKVYPGNSINEPQPESAVYDPIGHPYEYFFASGGGFSNIYPMPDYQKSAVERYFAENNPPYPYYSKLAANAPNPVRVNVSELQGDGEGLYNRIGRAYPDVTAIGDNIAVVVDGEFAMEGGTSASTPVFSSIINRINEERLAAGKKSIGFLNPTLYANPWVLNDVTNGTNPGCNTTGFKAAPGWDPASGLGTPVYPRMLELFLRLP